MPTHKRHAWKGVCEWDEITLARMATTKGAMAVISPMNTLLYLSSFPRFSHFLT